ncbi:MAG TPA: WD40 repeat domain-containing protein [Thermoanaerobaculia bacterium]|nr:WD40 repeat domain-containing protein [Thermoanaerobaculia bacterium]
MSGTAERLAATSPVPDAGMVDAENPWPGLASFREADRDFFHGRDAESGELTRLVLRERLTVLFGLSGLGKSSLLAAGVFPRLRQENVLPVPLRLDFSAGAAADLPGQVRQAILREATAAGIEAPLAPPGSTLWELFHRQGAEFWSPRNRLVTPLLAFDQFEEIFTLGRGLAATETFITELADLIEGRPPAAVKARLDAAPEAAKEFAFGRHSYKVLLSLREDFLPDLEELRDRIRSIVHNRLRLTRMNGGQALAVVTHPGGALIDGEVAEQVVRFVAGAAPGVPLTDLEIEPALLSVVCRELNHKRRQRGEAKITADLLEGSRAQILSDFYERSVADLPVATRTFVEDRLITTSGFRNSVALDDALEAPGVTREALDCLVERRLLRVEERGGGVERLELTHDVLTGVIRASRDRRRQRQAREEAEAAKRQAEEMASEARRKLQQSRRATIALGVLLLAALAGALWGFYGIRKAEQASALLQSALADSDMDEARHLEDAGNADQALAHLARGVRKDPRNLQVRSLLLARLLHRNWARLLHTLHHPAALSAAAFSRDGRWVATACDDKAAWVWNAATGRPAFPPFHHQAEVTAVEFSPDGSLLATVAEGAFLWDLAHGRGVSRIGGEPARVARFSPDGHRLLLVAAAPGQPEKAQAWDVATRQPASPPLGGTGAVLDAEWSPEGGRIATASSDGTAAVWDVATGRPLASTLHHQSQINSIRFSPDGRRVVTASADGTAQIWDAATGQPSKSHLVHQGHVNAARFSPDGRYVATASADDTAQVWDADTGRSLRTFRHGYAVLSAIFSPDSTRLLTASRDGTARIWNIYTGEQVTQSMRHDGTVESAEWSADGHRVLTSSDDHKARIWDVRPDAAPSLPLGGGPVDSARFGPEAGTVITTSAGAEQSWDAATNQPVGPPSRPAPPPSLAGLPGLPHMEEILATAFGPGGRLVVTAEANRARVWEARTGRPIRELTLPNPGRITALLFPPGNDRRLLTVAALDSGDSQARLWNLTTGLPTGDPMRHEAGIAGVAFSPDGETVVTASDDNTARLWKARTGEPIGEPMRHEGPVRSAVISPDGQRVVTASQDGTARIWDARSGHAIADPLRHDGKPVRSAAWSADSQRVVTVAADGVARLWDLPTGSAEHAGLLAALAESAGGMSFQDLGALITIPDRIERLTRFRAQLAKFPAADTNAALARWFLADPAERTLSPLSKMRPAARPVAKPPR